MVGVAPENEMPEHNSVSKDKNVLGFVTVLNLNFYSVLTFFFNLHIIYIIFIFNLIIYWRKKYYFYLKTKK